MFFSIQKSKTYFLALKIAPVLSFAISFIFLFFLNPISFEKTWKGRTYYILFLCILLIEIILNEDEKKKIQKFRGIKKKLVIILLFCPLIYAVISNFLGLNFKIIELFTHYNVPFAKEVPLAIEYIVFSVLLIFIAIGVYGTKILNSFLISILFLGLIGSIYMIDNVYPYGQFTPFQLFVPTTAHFAANMLNIMGYQTSRYTSINVDIGMTYLSAWEGASFNKVSFWIAWPCSGVESLIIYSVVIFLFLKKNIITLMSKSAYFIGGAIVTYVINIFRIVFIFVTAINGANTILFHDYYAQLFSIIWIISYPIIITIFEYSRKRNISQTFEKEKIDWGV